MAPKQTTVDFKIVVRPINPSGYTDEENKQQFSYISRKIRELIENSPYSNYEAIGSWDYKYACSHCGEEWKSYTSIHNSGCCDKDRELMRAVQELSL